MIQSEALKLAVCGISMREYGRHIWYVCSTSWVGKLHTRGCAGDNIIVQFIRSLWSALMCGLHIQLPDPELGMLAKIRGASSIIDISRFVASMASVS